MKHLVIILASLIASCSFQKQKPVKAQNPVDELRKKMALYASASIRTVDGFGWLSPPCDGLLFNSLAAVSGLNINIMAAEEAPGRWRRHPDFSTCKPFNGSRSTISRDMFRGLFIYLLKMKDTAALMRIREYGEANNWFMGEGEDPSITFSRTWFNPVIRDQLNRMITRDNVSIKNTELKDYEAHLDVLRIYTEFLISGYLEDYELDQLKEYRDANPENALYQAMYNTFTGDQAAAIDILMDEKYFPADRLPDETNYFAHYLWQRDYGPDWQPCNDGDEKRRCTGAQHSGVDFLFAAYIVIESRNL